MNKYAKRGFTLIELLVVIGVLAVIAAGVVALINPQDKLRQARDAKVQSDIGQLATALQSYAAQSTTGTYPLTNPGLSALAPGELTNVPRQPDGGVYNYQSATGATAVVYGSMTSQKSITAAAQPAPNGAGCAAGAAIAYWKWSSTTGGGPNTCWSCAANYNPCP